MELSSDLAVTFDGAIYALDALVYPSLPFPSSAYTEISLATLYDQVQDACQNYDAPDILLPLDDLEAEGRALANYAADIRPVLTTWQSLALDLQAQDDACNSPEGFLLTASDLQQVIDRYSLILAGKWLSSRDHDSTCTIGSIYEKAFKEVSTWFVWQRSFSSTSAMMADLP